VRVVAALNADLDQTPLGTKSRLADELAGVPILRRTIQRITRTPSVQGVYVFCPTAQRDRIAKLIDGTGATVCQHNAGPPPWATLIRTARKWSLDGWRGGIGGATSFDESTDPRLLAGLLNTAQTDAVLCVPPAAALFDPKLAERIIGHRREIQGDAKMTFAQAPPGLTAILLDADVIKELDSKSLPVGAIFAYKPAAPQKDMIFEPCCCPTSASIRFATGRLIADTDRAIARMQQLLTEGADTDAETIGQRLVEMDERGSEPRPIEVEIELTTDDPYPDNLHRPRGKRVPPRDPMSLDCIARVADELCRCDDMLCVLGGFGDPLRHPDFPAVLKALRPADHTGVFGLAVRTCAADLTDDLITELLDHRVDILNVTLDAWTPQTYAHVQDPARSQSGRVRCADQETDANLAKVLANLDRLAAMKVERQSVAPLVVPELCKSRETIDEMDAFYNGWMDRLGIACITGFNHYGHRLTDRSVIRMAPSTRTPCRRVRSRAMILANGNLTLCDQDFEGTSTIGNVMVATLGDLWGGPTLCDARKAHLANSPELPSLCLKCDEWHRP